MDNSYYRVMALDYGDVRIGIALSDVTRFLASGYENYTRKELSEDCRHIAQIASEKGVKVIVLGLPLNMDGSSGVRVEKTYEFAEELSKYTDAKIDYLDERLTSVSAEKILISADVSRKKRKDVIDKLSATIILQDYLDSHKIGN
ncbi:MAG: Holliday junction resolvase RuvX [Firmicutes bacterium]|nr:Holliday junction resolvase RuvX [Bacillota bacterium]MDY5676924.1 Holliday junction resolvase RuvX [Eubacteriales bacterium]